MRIALALVLIATASAVSAQDAPQGPARPPRFASSVADHRGRARARDRRERRRDPRRRGPGARGQRPRNAFGDDRRDGHLRDSRSPAGQLEPDRIEDRIHHPAGHGQKRPFAAAQPLTVAERQSLQANFTLGRAGAISGRVLDEFGDPVAGARVQVLRSRYTRGRRTLAPTGVGDQTDDTGAFRLYALPPGDYYVGAALRAATAETPLAEAQVGAQTYYPGTPVLAEAQRIRLGVGEEQPNLTFSLSPVRAVRVSGTVLSARGGPAEDASVRLLSVDRLQPGGRAARQLRDDPGQRGVHLRQRGPRLVHPGGARGLGLRTRSGKAPRTRPCRSRSARRRHRPDRHHGAGGTVTGRVHHGKRRPASERNADPLRSRERRHAVRVHGGGPGTSERGRAAPGRCRRYGSSLPIMAGGFHLGVITAGGMDAQVDRGGRHRRDRPPCRSCAARATTRAWC